MYGDLVRIRENAIFVEGQEPSMVLRQLDIPSVLVYRAGDALYVLDTGATSFFRERILEAVRRLRPFSRLVILNTHSHPDHTANNGVIRDIEAEEKLHYLSRVGIPELNYEKSIIHNYEEISRYYFFLQGPRFPYSLVTRPLGLTRYLNPRTPYSFVRGMIKKFAPLEPSLETVRPFEDVESGPLDIGPTTWPGWKISDEVWALETRGHSPDSVSFYLPGEKILYLGDETLKYFNCWLDSRATKVRAALELAMRLLETGTVKTIIGGHQQKPYEDAEAKGLLSRLLHDYDIMEQEIFSALNAFPQGATAAQVYGRLRKRKNDVAELRAFFEYEFPKMPVLLKTLVVGLLLENGCQAVGPDGKKKFTRR